MRDTVVHVTGPWEAESVDECEVVPTTWNLGSLSQGGVSLSADIKVKLRKLAAINDNHRNWSWLLDLNRPPVYPVLPRVPVSGKSRPRPQTEVPCSGEEPTDIDIRRLRVSERMVSVKKKRVLDQPSQPPRPKVNS